MAGVGLNYRPTRMAGVGLNYRLGLGFSIGEGQVQASGSIWFGSRLGSVLDKLTTRIDTGFDPRSNDFRLDDVNP